MIYKANPAYRLFSDDEATVVGKAIARLCKKGKGTPCDIVRTAEPETSELHPYFTWDDSIAGFNWRKQEARTLVNAIVTVTDDGIEMAAFESVPCVVFDDESQEPVSCGRIYKPTATILSNDDDYGLLCSEIRQVINAYRRKLRTYEGKKATDAQLRLLDATAKAFGE